MGSPEMSQEPFHDPLPSTSGDGLQRLLQHFNQLVVAVRQHKAKDRIDRLKPDIIEHDYPANLIKHLVHIEEINQYIVEHVGAIDERELNTVSLRDQLRKHGV